MRPYVQLISENKRQELFNALINSLDKFISLDGVIGIILDGGLSRGYGDHLSEIDIIIYLSEEQFIRYNQGECPIGLGITIIDGYLYDIKIANFEKELKRDFDSVELWDLSYSIILHDKYDKIADFKNKKLSKVIEISNASGLLWESYWYYKLAGDIWIHRQDIIQGHFTLNNAIKPLISSLFITNQEYIPHDKWLIHMSKSLQWKPNEWETLLKGAFNTGDFSLQSLMERQKYIDKIWNNINHKLCEMTDFFCNLDFVQKRTYEILMKLLEKSEYTIDQWETYTSIEELNYEPIHSIFKRVDNKILLDKDKFISIKPEDMYVWMYNIVDEVRKSKTMRG